MKVVIQRVKKAAVVINDKIYSQINAGFLILIGISKNDTVKQAQWLVQKIANLRIMADKQDKMNLSIKETKGEILVVSQFTLLANCLGGNRPSFIKAAKPGEAKKLYEFFIDKLRCYGLSVKTGSFGSLMEVNLTNDGPVTIVMEN